MHVLLGVGFQFVRWLKRLQLGLCIERFKVIIQVELGDGAVPLRIKRSPLRDHRLLRERISLCDGLLLTWQVTGASIVDKRERILVNDQSICLLRRSVLLLILD